MGGNVFQALLSRGRRPAKIKIICDGPLYPGMTLNSFVHEGVRISVCNGLHLSPADILKLMGPDADKDQTENAIEEDTLMVVAAGIYSVLNDSPSPSINVPSESAKKILNKEEVSSKSDVNNHKLSRNVSDRLISQAVSVWSTVLSSTRHSDVVFLPASLNLECMSKFSEWVSTRRLFLVFCSMFSAQMFLRLSCFLCILNYEVLTKYFLYFLSY